MRKSFMEAEIRAFNPISVPGLTDEAREAVNAALKAMSSWRNELVETNEKNGKRVIDKMASAAAALGWPQQIVDAARTQLQTIAEAQIKMMDQVTDAWEEQLGLQPPGALQKAAALPLQFWMQMAEQWRKSWEQVMTSWVNSRKGD